MCVIKVLSLDAFGTLIFPRIPIGNCYSQFAWETCGLHLPAKKVESQFFKVYKEMNLKYPNFGSLNNMSSRTWWNKLISQTFGLCLKTDYYDVPAKHTDRLYDWYGLAEAWKIDPNTFESLEYLKQNNIKLAALSNFDERLPKIFNGLGLDIYFDNIVYSSILPFWKPDIRIFQHICQLFSIDSKNLFHCGDNYEKDYEAALRFGAQAAIFLFESDTAVGYRDSVVNKSINPEHIMRSLEQLSRYVVKISKQ